MPFTLSHTSAVIFLKSKRLNLGGLILGSMAPDFIYFLLFNPSNNLGHTPIGFLFLNLPLCFILNFLFYKYIQNCFLLTLPNFISKRYLYLIKSKNKLTTIKEYIIFSYSCIIGMLTHVLWDAFTHKTGFFVNNIDFLRSRIILLGYNIPVYKLLQHVSTFIGFLVLFIFLYNIRDKNPRSLNISINKFKFLISVFSVQIITLILSYMFSVSVQGNFGIGQLVVTFINGLFLGYLVTGFIYNKRVASKYI
ncbi:DUF4184 family protein [Hathewaya histolytica]|uniref:DUF4184 family protein n=1 Tax=Hathewaya histolytica TaxID=1498 RepID=UPI003B679E6D